MKYYRISVSGIVQGVGFRPFVCREAKKYGITGTVKNIAGNVEILAALASGGSISRFAESIKLNKPRNSYIDKLEITPAAPFSAEGFTVIESGPGDRAPRFFPPDMALCPECRAEIFDPASRRFRHFFNTCTACGPRYTMLKAFPYDRANTAMDKFPMCADCEAEYNSAESRRFHDEGVCCPKCGPELLYRRGETLYRGEEAFAMAVKDLPGGIAVKGVGGYHLAASPYDGPAVQRLRLIKAREKKPFALMFRDIRAVAEVCEIAPEEERLLLSPARPIVLLKMKRNPFAEEVLCGADGRCGCFLPYTPLQELLLAEIPCLVITSANLSASPIISDEAGIFPLTGRVLYHSREIVRSAEDSVAQVVEVPDYSLSDDYAYKTIVKPFFIRRARGYAPLPIAVDNPRGTPLLAVGGDLKAAFGLLNGQSLILSQYVGDLENAQTYEKFVNSINDLENLFAVHPEAVVCDAHPRYFSAELAAKLAAERKIPLIKVFHHHAHIASVMAERRLARVLGVALDGNGFGEDGNVWGGEFLLCEDARCRRVGHLAYTELLGADSAARDAAKTALCYLYTNGLASAHPSETPRPEQTIIEAALAGHVNTFLTSSMGRLFDAAAALLGVCRENGYEGECAVRLQYAAEKAAKSGITPLPMSFGMKIENGVCVFDCRDIIEKCLAAGKSAAGKNAGRQSARARNDTETLNSAEQRMAGQNPAARYERERDMYVCGAALGFHTAICDMIEQMCVYTREKERINDVALSGGVFQNALLLEMVMKRLAAAGFSVYTNEAVPPNDGGIALGQAFIYWNLGKNEPGT